jgi:hypothetical protein
MKHSRRGFILYDMLAALAVVLTLSVVLATVGHRAQAAERRMADVRAAARAAEAVAARVLTDPASPAPAELDGVAIRLERLPAEAGVDPFRVVATTPGGARAEVTGFWPAGNGGMR